jgi:hypothetical protein
MARGYVLVRMSRGTAAAAAANCDGERLGTSDGAPRTRSLREVRGAVLADGKGLTSNVLWMRPLAPRKDAGYADPATAKDNQFDPDHFGVAGQLIQPVASCVNVRIMPVCNLPDTISTYPFFPSLPPTLLWFRRRKLAIDVTTM